MNTDPFLKACGNAIPDTDRDLALQVVNNALHHSPQMAMRHLRGILRGLCALIVIFCLLVISSPVTGGSSGGRVVRVGAFNYYPGIFRDSDGAVKGFYVDALADMARREGIRIEYVYGSWSEGIQRLKAGAIDVLTSVAYTPERSAFMDYSKEPLLTVWGELYVRPESEIDGIREVRGKRIAVMKEDVNARHFKELVRKFDISCDFEEMPGFEEVFQAVAERRVDAGVVNCTFGVPKQKEYGLRSTGIIFNPFDIYFAVAKDRNRDLLNLLNVYLQDWRHNKDSVYNTARQRWAHGAVGTVYVMPGWLLNSLAVLGIAIFVAIVFIALLKNQVRRATDGILKREASLRESEEKFRSYIDHSPEGIFVTDEEGRYLEVNRTACDMTGYTEEELLAMGITDWAPAECREATRHLFRIMLEQGHVSGELEFLHKNGSRRWRSVNAVKLSETRCLGFTKDITERKSAENTLRLQAMVLEQIHDSVTVTDLRGTITYVNQAERSRLGYEQKELIGRSVEVYGEDSLRGATQRQIIEQTLAKGQWRGEVVNFAVTGQPVILDCRTSLVFDENGQPIGMCGVATDISDRKKFEESLRSSLAEKEVLLREVHHRVKNNLAAIIGLLDLQRSSIQDAEVQRMLVELSNRVRSMSLVHEKLYRSDSLSNIDCQDYLDDLIFQLRCSYDTRDIHFEVTATGVEMPLDVAVPCGIIVNELITNSLKYAFPDKKPRPGTDGCRIQVSLARNRESYTLTVSDNGAGFPAGLDWTRAKTLGLLLVRMLGQHQLGGICELNRDSGTRFTLTFTTKNGRNDHEQGNHSHR